MKGLVHLYVLCLLPRNLDSVILFFFHVCSKDISFLFPQAHRSTSLVLPLHLYKCILKCISTVNKQQTFTEHLGQVPGIVPGDGNTDRSRQCSACKLTKLARENQHTSTALVPATL